MTLTAKVRLGAKGMTGRQEESLQSRGKGTGATRQKPGRKEGKEWATEVKRSLLDQEKGSALLVRLPGARHKVGVGQG